MAINGEWHRAHLMPKNATIEQRLEWHLAHLASCGCRRDLPESVRRYAAEKGIDVPGSER